MKTTAALRSVAAGSLFLAAALAFSQDDNGFYLSVATMATFAAPHDFAVGPKPADNDGFTANRTGSGSFGVGILGFRVAYGFDIFGFRPEAELSYRQVALSSFRYSSFSQAPEDELSATDLDTLNDSIVVKSGHLVLLGAMANLWFDIPTGSPVSPYLGGGVGLGRVTLDSHSRARFAGASLVRQFPESSASAFAFQAGSGVGFDVGEGLSLSLGYRLAGTTEAQLAWNAKGSSTDELLKVGVLLHSIELGIGYRF